MKPEHDYQGLGITFITLGVGLTISLGLTLGVAFIGTGIPLIVVGAVFLSKQSGDAESDGSEG